MNTFSLLKQRRFTPLFWVQFSSAMNNNIFKNGLMVLITYQSLNIFGLSPAEVINLAMGLFILPFFLFSTLAGFMADKYEKSHLIQKIKLLEVCIMVLASLAFYLHSLIFLLFVLFLLGIQATLFGPLKYSILPQHLNDSELTSGNALIEMGTFIAILIGTLLGSAIIYIPGFGIPLTLGILLCSALTTYIASFYIPYAAANAPGLHFTYKAISNIGGTLQIARKNKTVFIGILAISWFWLYGAFVLTQLPSYVKLIIGGNARIFTLFLALFSIGIALGSLLCSQLSKKQGKSILVTAGAIGMSLFTISLFLVSPKQPAAHLLSLMEFLMQPSAYLIILSLVGLSLSAGLYTVPLFTFIQQHSDPAYRSRIIAANNIMNALFMVLAAIMGIILLSFHLTITEMLLCLGIGNFLFNSWLYYKARLSFRMGRIT